MKRSIPLFAALAFLASGLTAAQASDSERLAERGGFLLGSARHCGVPADRVVKVAKTIGRLIAAASNETGDGDAAITRFSEFYLATATAGTADENGLTLDCRRVVAEFRKLEHHPIKDAAK
ncbi:MAG TPA: hypothetical protein VFA12_07195 [Stellaceae bacterium]|nr:hypothetical protein [Stellaceae bacterium]